MKRIIRVFPKRTSYTPDDDYVYVGMPDMFIPDHDEIHISCAFTWDKKYCGAKLKGEYLVKQGMCFYCDNDDCGVKPITDYNYASSNTFKAEVNEITMDKWEE